MPRGDQRLVEAFVVGLHELRNRVAYLEPLIHQPSCQRYEDLLAVTGYLDPALRDWVHRDAAVSAVLDRRA